jgi:hypothetical protein
VLGSVALAAAILLCGCTTVYQGTRLQPDGTFADQSRAGIPFTLPMAEYKLLRDGTGTPARYKVAVSYVPDPAHRYTIRLSPALLANVDFGAELGEQGELGAASAKTVEQITPTLKAVGGLVVSVLAAAAPRVAVPAAAMAIDERKGSLALLTSPDTYSGCLLEPTVANETRCAIRVARPNCNDEAALRIVSRTEEFIADPPMPPWPDEPDTADTGDLFATLHYLDQEERKCMDLAREGMAGAGSAGTDYLVAEVDREIVAPGGSLSAQVAAVIKASITAADPAQAKRLMAALLGPAEDRVDLLKREGVIVDSVDQAEVERLRTALTKLGFLQAGRPAAPVEQLAQTRTVVLGLERVTRMELAEWRARHLVYLDGQIDLALAAPLRGAPAPAQDLAALRREYARTAGKERQFDRLAVLEQHLDNLPPPQPSDRISAFDEYGKARAEVERLETEIAQAAEAMIAEMAPEPAAPQSLPESLPVVSEAEIVESTKDGWFYGKGVDAPDFVLFLRRVEGKPSTPTPGGGQ